MLNREKSVLIPCTRLVFFGFLLDSVEFKVFLPQEKVVKILALAQRLLSAEMVTVRSLATFIGVIIQTFVAVWPGPMHYRDLERQKVYGLYPNMSYDNVITLSDVCRREIQWWKTNLVRCNGKTIRPPSISFWITTDASLKGWGVAMRGKSVGGRWSLSEQGSHINYLELLAMFFGLKSFCRDCHDIHIGIQSDSSTAVSYLNQMGGMRSRKLDFLASEIWNWCIDRNVFVTAQFIPGVDNVEADRESRNFSENKEWVLKPEIFVRICDQTFMPEVDLFASRIARQLDNYVAWTFDPDAIAIDAFSIDWRKLRPFVFPPFVLLGKILTKIVHDEVEDAIVIAPHWHSQSWFPLLLSCLISLPISLPNHQDLLSLPHSGELHPLRGKMRLIACHVSGDRSKVRAFQRGLSTQSSRAGEMGHRNSTNTLGDAGSFGVLDGVSVPLIHLKWRC
jgi:hypothetical protein